MNRQVLRLFLLAFCWIIGTIITEAQENFCLENDVTADFIKNVVYPDDDYSFTKITQYYKQTTDYKKDLPFPVRLSVPNTSEGKSLILETYCYGEKVRTDEYAVGERLLEIWNLIPQTSYSYKLYVLYSDNTKKEVASGRFRTEGQVRMMNIENVRNFRDLGGWKLPNNQRVKYDRIFRSAELATTSQAITDAGIDEMINVQKIQVELDFSFPYSGTSPVSGYLEHVHGSEYEILQCADGLKTFSTQYKNSFEKTVNSLRAGKKVLFHCIFGADRTGTFAFLLEGLLGVSESDLAKEYELTNFYHTARHRTANTNGYKETIDYIKSTFSGSTINEKIEKMALGLGISQKDIDDFRSLMTESNIPSYALTYYVDGTEYKTYKQQKGKAITPETAPTKEGYTFSGWSGLPQTMPANDVEVTGAFTINNYKIKYMVDGTEYKTAEIQYGASITPEEEPTKEGYTFSGWSEIPETMPAQDLTVNGSFTEITEDVITIGESGKALYCSKYDLDFANMGVKAYTSIGFETNTNTLWLARMENIPAGTGIMLKGVKGEYHVPHGKSYNFLINLFKGDAHNDMTVSRTEGDYTNFFLNKSGQIVPFGEETVTYPAGRCYLQIPTALLADPANTRSINYAFDDEDGTTSISTATATQEPDVYYNLQGQRVDNPTKGLYIVNGRKVVIR